MLFWWFLAQLAIDAMINPKLWKPISPFHTFQYPKGQMGTTSPRIVWFQNVDHHYKWENVCFNNIQKTVCTEESHFDRMGHIYLNQCSRLPPDSTRVWQHMGQCVSNVYIASEQKKKFLFCCTGKKNGYYPL